MKKELEFSLINISKTEAIQATKSYFLNHGFLLVNDSTDTIEFKRGNLWLNMVTFNPLKWKSLIKIVFSGTAIMANFTIDTTFQAVTLKEEQLWDRFISNYKETVKINIDYASINKKLLLETKLNSLKYVKAALIGGFVAGIPAGIIAHFSGLHNILGVAASGGAISYMMYKIEKDKKTPHNIT